MSFTKKNNNTEIHKKKIPNKTKIANSTQLGHNQIQMAWKCEVRTKCLYLP